MSDSDDAFASADEGDKNAAVGKTSTEPAKSSNPKGGGDKPSVKKKSESGKAESIKKPQRPNSGDKAKSEVESKSAKPKSPVKKGNPKGAKPRVPTSDKKPTTVNPDSKSSESADNKTEKETISSPPSEAANKDSSQVQSDMKSLEKKTSEVKDDQKDSDLESVDKSNTNTDSKSAEKDTLEDVSRTDTSDHSASSPQNKKMSQLVEEKTTAGDDSSSTSASEKAVQAEKQKESGGGWNWGTWGTSLMSAATNSVTTFTSQVEEGFNTLVDAVENSLGALTPEELAEMKKQNQEEAPEEAKIEREDTVKVKPEEEEKTEKPVEKKSSEGATGEEATTDKEEDSWFSSWGLSSGISSLSSVAQKTSNIVQSTGKSFVTGSIDVLETIGKKTFDVIKDHDPGIRKTKEVLFERGDKPNLSQMLREAKDEAEMRAEVDREFEEARKAHFGSLFDDYQGLAHLEALEILSNQCEKKVHTLLGSMPVETLSAIKVDLVNIKQMFEWDESEDDEDELKEHEFARLVTDNLSELHLGTTPDKLNTSQAKIRQKIADFYTKEEAGEKTQPKELHQMAIQALAELTSKSVEQFHKSGELVLLQKDSDKPWTDRAKCLKNLTKVLCTEVGIVSSKFTHCLNKLGEAMEDSSCINPLVTNIYLEAGNSSTYIQDAFQLLLPCLQEATIQGSLDQGAK